MEKFILLFDEFLLKAITMTESFLAADLAGDVDLEGFTANRERLLQVLDQISRQVDWPQVAPERRREFDRQIDYIKKLDEAVLVKLQEHQAEVRREIERTVRSRENIKGYNLTDVK
jgi:hypothetical protein